MADTKRTLSDLQSIFPDNTTEVIDAQQVRDLAISTYGTWRSKSIVFLDSPYPVTANDTLLLADCTSGSIVINLPTGATYNDMISCVKKKDKTSNTITINCGGSDTFFDGTTSFVISEFGGGLFITKVGTLWARVQEKDFAGLFTAMKEPTGFPNRTDATVSFTNGSKTFAIAPVSAQFDYYIKGVRYIKTASVSKAISDADGIHYIYFDGATLSESTTAPTNMFTDVALVALVNWDVTNQVNIGFAEERHGIIMDGITHEQLHDTRGCAWETGLDLGNYVLRGDGSSNTHAQISLTDGNVFDEDIEVNIKNAASPTNPFEQILSTVAQVPTYYRSGASGVWRKNTAAVYPLKTGTNRIQWNQYTGGSWSQIDSTADGNFVAYWIFATNNRTEPVIAVMGQREDTSFSASLINRPPSALALGGLILPEMKLLYRLIFRTSSAFGNTPKASLWDITDYRAAVILPNGLKNITAGAIGFGLKTRELFFGGSTADGKSPGATDCYNATGVGSSANANLTFCVPLDFVFLVNFSVVIISGVTNATANIDLSSQYGPAGGAFNANTGSETAATYNLTTNNLHELDASPIVSSLAAGHIGGVKVTTTTVGAGGIYLLGLRLRYNIE